MAPQALNKNNSAVKRIMQEARELANDPSTDYTAAPLEDDIFEWHCTIRGPPGTEFEGGIYHFRIVLPAEYPFRPPSIMMLTPNGRFELNTKICISFTNYHEELWQPAWGVRTAIIGLQGFFPLRGQAAVGVGSIESHTAERKRLAVLSRDWTCPHCQVPNIEILPDPVPTSATLPTSPVTSLDASSPTTPEPNSAPHDQPMACDPSHSQRPNEAADNTAHLNNGVLPDRIPANPPSSPHLPHVPEPEPRSAGVAVAVAGNSPAATVEFPHSNRRSAQKPPVLLDTAIMILLVLLFAIICRRVV